MTIGLGPHGGGVLRLVRPGVYLHWCPGCRCGHAFDVHAVNQDGKVNGWDGDVRRPSVDRPLRHDTPAGVCEYRLAGGVLAFTTGSHHALAGQSVDLVEYPR